MPRFSNFFKRKKNEDKPSDNLNSRSKVYPLTANNEESIKPSESNGSFGVNWVLWGLLGLVIILLSILIEENHNKFKDFESISLACSHLLRDVGIAILSAALIAKIIEVPNFIHFVNERTIEAL